MTLQAPHPLEHHSLQASNWRADDIVHRAAAEWDLHPPYQRPSVWGTSQRQGIIRSWLLGIPIPAIILNDRTNPAWPTGAEGHPQGGFLYGVIDGKQRIETAMEWFGGHLSVPATWFPREHVQSTQATDDGPYVRYRDLTQVGRRRFNNKALLPVIHAQLDSIHAEADLYLLVNAAGTPQADIDLARAARVAASS